MRVSAQRNDRKSNLKWVIKAKTIASLAVCLPDTKKDIFVEHFLKHLVHRQSNYCLDKWSKRVSEY